MEFFSCQLLSYKVSEPEDATEIGAPYVNMFIVHGCTVVWMNPIRNSVYSWIDMYTMQKERLSTLDKVIGSANHTFIISSSDH